jgi:plastocyanin domain-containing protein
MILPLRLSIQAHTDVAVVVGQPMAPLRVTNIIMTKYYTFGTILIVLLLGFFLFKPSKAPSVISASSSDMAPVVSGKQIVKMTVSTSGYSPNLFKIKAGVPVVWQISSPKGSGCAGTIISRELFPEAIIVPTYGQIDKEFTVSSPGTYRFTCGMGMYTGFFEVSN